MMEPQPHPLNVHLPAAAGPTHRSTSGLRVLVVTYLLGMLVLSPEQFLALPANLTSGDFWNLIFLPICWWYLIRSRQAMRLPYAIGMWFIWLGSFIGALFAWNPLVSILFITKEIYLYVWFVTLVSVFASLEPGLVRRLLLVWLVVAVLHGILLVAEFALPNFYRFMLSFLGSIGIVWSRFIGRPAGLFEDPVWAALFQMMGFLPLLLVGLRRELSLLLGIVLLLSILATASLGPFTAVLGASLVAVLLLLLMGGRLRSLVWLATVLTIAAGLFLFILSLFPDVQARLQHLTVDRADHTAGERLLLWEGGSDILFSADSILGVGPDNFRDPVENKTLHNDTLEFIVERGVIGLLGLVLLSCEALNSAIRILLNQIKSRDTALPSGIVFLAMLVAVYLESNTHQVFHFRAVWLGLALLEATRFRMVMSPSVEIAAKRMELGEKRLQPLEELSPFTDRSNSSSAEVG